MSPGLCRHPGGLRGQRPHLQPGDRPLCRQWAGGEELRQTDQSTPAPAAGQPGRHHGLSHQGPARPGPVQHRGEPEEPRHGRHKC